jgi:hypothetical protein
MIVADGPKAQVLTVDNLELAYEARIRLARVDDYWLAYPAESG